MKNTIYAFLLIPVSLFATYNNAVKLINKQEKVLRVTSDEFSHLLKELNGLTEKELKQLLDLDLNKKQIKNLLAAMSRMESKKLVFNLLFERILKADGNQKLYSYFTYIVYDPEFLVDIEKKLSATKDIKPFLTFLGSKASKEAFSLILSQHSLKNDLSKELLNTVTDKNIKEVISLLKNKVLPGEKLAEKLLSVDTGTYDSDTLAFMLNGKLKIKKIEFPKEQIAQLTELYKSLNQEDFTNIAGQILSEEISPELNHKVRSHVDLNNELVKKVFQAKALNYNFNTYKKYEKYINLLNSSNIKTRLQALLKLRDYSDPILAPTYIHFLSDSSADIRRDALDCLTNILEKNKNALSKYLPIKGNSELDLLINQQKAQSVSANSDNESQSDTLIKIVQLLHDPNPPVIVSAIELLTFVNTSIANKQIISLLTSDNPQILISAIASVEKTEANGALLKLIALLHHKDWKVRARAAKAIDAFENKGEFLPRLESMFFKEKDPFVKGHIFNFLKESENPDIFAFLKQKAKEAKNPEEKYDNLTKLLNLKNLPASEIELLRPEFHKFSNSTFCEEWLSVAGKKKLNIKKELILALQRGSADNKKSALMVAGRRGIDASPYLSKKSYYEIGYSYIFYYMRENKLLDTKPKMEMLKFILLDPKFPEYNEALVSLKNRISDELHLNDPEKETVYSILREAKKKVPAISQTIISLVLGEKIPNSTIDSLMQEYSNAKDKSTIIPAITILAEKVTAEQAKMYENQFTELLLESHLRPYNLQNILRNFSLENLKKLFESSTSYQDDYLKAMAFKITFSEMLKLTKNLFGKKYVSEYEIYDALKLSVNSMKSEDIEPLLEILNNSSKQNSYYVSQLSEKIPNTIREDIKKLVRKGDLDASPMVFHLASKSFTEKDFDVFYKLTSQIKVDTNIRSYGQRSSNFDFFYNASKDKIENSEVDLEILQFYENIQKFSSSGSGFSRNIDAVVFEKRISDINKKYRGRVFEILENAGRKSQAFYDLYFSLIENDVDPIIYKKSAPTQGRHYLYDRGSMHVQHAEGSSVIGSLKKNKSPEKTKEKILARLLELKNSLKGYQLSAIALRASKLLTNEQYITYFHKLFKENPALVEFTPAGAISKESFKLIRDNVNLKLVSEYKANDIGRNLHPELSKELIAEYRKNYTEELWPFIIEKLGPNETDLILNSLISNFESLKKNMYSSGNNQVRNQFSRLAEKLRRPQFSNKLQSVIGLTHEDINTVYMLALLSIKLPQEPLEKLLDMSELNDDQKKLLINTFYINGTYTPKVFKLHENYLSKLNGKVLAEAIKLSPKYHDGNSEERNSFSSSDNLSIQQVISYSGASYHSYNEDKKAISIPESAKEAYNSLNNKKLKVYQKANDPSLFQYVLDKNNITLKVVNQYLENGAEELDGPLLETLNEQFQKASIEDIKIFLNHILQKDIYLNLNEPNNMGKGFDEEKVTYLKKVFTETKSDNIKSLLQPVYYNSIKTDAEFDTLVKNLMADKEGNIYGDMRSMAAISEKLKAAIFRYLENYKEAKTISNNNLLYILSSLNLENEDLTSLDQYLPKLSPQIQQNFMRVLLREGPYLPNTLKAYLTLLDKPSQNTIFLDLSYLFYKKALDEKKLEPVRETFEKIKAKKLNIYNTTKNQTLKSILLLTHQDVKLIKTELDKALEKNTVKPYDIYIVHRFAKEEQEKYAKLLWEKFKGSEQSYYIQSYLKDKNYAWLPKIPDEESF